MRENCELKTQKKTKNQTKKRMTPKCQCCKNAYVSFERESLSFARTSKTKTLTLPTAAQKLPLHRTQTYESVFLVVVGVVGPNNVICILHMCRIFQSYSPKSQCFPKPNLNCDLFIYLFSTVKYSRL